MDPRSEKPLVVSFPVDFVGRRKDEIVISINTKNIFIGKSFSVYHKTKNYDHEKDLYSNILNVFY